MPHRVLDALIDRQNRQITGSAQTTMIEKRLQIAQDVRIAIGLHEHAVHEIGAWQFETFLGNAATGMAQQ